MVVRITQIIQGLFAVAVLGAVVVGITYVFLLAPKTERSATTVGQFLQYKSTAQVYYGRMSDFSGLCGELAVGPEVQCRDSENAYRVATKYTDDSWYCIDDTGFEGEVFTIRNEGFRCQ